MALSAEDALNALDDKHVAKAMKYAGKAAKSTAGGKSAAKPMKKMGKQLGKKGAALAQAGGLVGLLACFGGGDVDTEALQVPEVPDMDDVAGDALGAAADACGVDDNMLQPSSSGSWMSAMWSFITGNSDSDSNDS